MEMPQRGKRNRFSRRHGRTSSKILIQLITLTKPNNKMQRLKIDVKKIKKELLFDGAKGLYMDLTLMDNREGPDQYGNDGFIVQDVGKERREAGEKGPIVGNWKHIGQRSPAQNTAPPPSRTATADALDESDDIPFL